MGTHVLVVMSMALVVMVMLVPMPMPMLMSVVVMRMVMAAFAVIMAAALVMHMLVPMPMLMAVLVAVLLMLVVMMFMAMLMVVVAGLRRLGLGGSDGTTVLALGVHVTDHSSQFRTEDGFHVHTALLTGVHLHALNKSSQTLKESIAAYTCLALLAVSFQLESNGTGDVPNSPPTSCHMEHGQEMLISLVDTESRQ